MSEDDNSAIQNILGVAVGQSRPHKNLTYEAFSNAIARRDKTSLLLGASKILWTLWKGEAPPNTTVGLLKRHERGPAPCTRWTSTLLL
jgi:hypothetical protein